MPPGIKAEALEHLLQGRHILWGWLQERRKMGSYDYAGCMSLPRLLHLRGNKLIQEPVPEVTSLRQGAAWHAQDLSVFPEEPLPIGGVKGSALDIQVTFERFASVLHVSTERQASVKETRFFQKFLRPFAVWITLLLVADPGAQSFSTLVQKQCDANDKDWHLLSWRVRVIFVWLRGSATAAGVLVRSWNAGEDGGAAIIYDWEHGKLEAVFQGDGDITALADLDPEFDGPRRFGGDVELPPGEPLKVQTPPCKWFVGNMSKGNGEWPGSFECCGLSLEGVDVPQN